MSNHIIKQSANLYGTASSEATGVLNVHFGDFLIFPLFWSPQDFKLLPLRSSKTKCFWKCWTQGITTSPAWCPKLCLLPALQSCCSLAFFRWLRTLKTQPQYQVIWPFSSISKENVFLGFWSMRVKQFWKWQTVNLRIWLKPQYISKWTQVSIFTTIITCKYMLCTC